MVQHIQINEYHPSDQKRRIRITLSSQCMPKNIQKNPTSVYNFIIKKTFKIIENKWNLSNITKAVFDKPIVNIILKGEKLKAFPVNQEQDSDIHYKLLFFNLVLSPS